MHKTIDEPDEEKLIASARFKNGRVCPYCGGQHVIKNGTQNGKARYRCEECRRYFSNRTNTVLAWSHMGLDVWNRFMECMLEKKTLGQSARICGISKTTAFAWRHKILDSMRDNIHEGVLLGGVAEADETFVALSYKGNHKKAKNFTMPRKRHKRGNDVHTRGLSCEQVCITSAIDGCGKSVACPTNTAKPRKEHITDFLSKHIKEGSTICTDKNRAYRQLIGQKKLHHVIFDSAKHEYSRGQYGIQRINNYHGGLKRFLNHFIGVSTKYLNNYLVWHNFVNYAKEAMGEKLRLLQELVMCGKNNTRGYSLSLRPPKPF